MCYKVTLYGTGRITGISDRRVRTELFAGRGEAASDPAGREPGDPSSGGGGGRAVVRSVVEGRHAHRSRAGAARLRGAPAPPVRRSPDFGARVARPPARARAHRLERGGRAQTAPPHRTVPGTTFGKFCRLA